MTGAMTRTPHYSKRLLLAVCVLLSALLIGCIDQADSVDYGDPTALNTPTTASGITAFIESPLPSELLTASQVEIVVAAYTDPPVALALSLIHISEPTRPY